MCVCVCVCVMYMDRMAVQEEVNLCAGIAEQTRRQKNILKRVMQTRALEVHICVCFFALNNMEYNVGAVVLWSWRLRYVCVCVSGVSQIGNGWKLNGNQQKKNHS